MWQKDQNAVTRQAPAPCRLGRGARRCHLPWLPSVRTETAALSARQMREKTIIKIMSHRHKYRHSVSDTHDKPIMQYHLHFKNEKRLGEAVTCRTSQSLQEGAVPASPRGTRSCHWNRFGACQRRGRVGPASSLSWHPETSSRSEEEVSVLLGTSQQHLYKQPSLVHKRKAVFCFLSGFFFFPFS